MKIVLTEHDRQLLMKRFLAASAMENPDNIVTVLYVTEIHGGNREEE